MTQPEGIKVIPYQIPLNTEGGAATKGQRNESVARHGSFDKSNGKINRLTQND